MDAHDKYRCVVLFHSFTENIPRIPFSHLQHHISHMQTTKSNGSNARRHFTWFVILDVFELLDSCGSSSGHYCVDLDDLDLRRYLKFLVHLYS
ncbi:hypothetical protein CRG98_047417 [Punica granatum]|uniref:Uncharacterized protein n=1 Tax=Punica granatum TaxID=22663 RepID=A0A2I0HKJ2_PUNGR|nr:hypothetical protein CRG98_047417 [Punica granatum]